MQQWIVLRVANHARESGAEGALLVNQQGMTF